MKAAVVMGIVCLLLCAGVDSAQATNQWVTTVVNEVGISRSGKTLIRLSDAANKPIFQKKWFVLPEKTRKEMLAIGLSSVAARLTLRVRVDLEEAEMPVIKIMYVQDE